MMVENIPIKKYAVLVDDMTMAYLGKIIPSLRFLEIEGVNLQGHEGNVFLVNPVKEEFKPHADDFELPKVCSVDTEECEVCQ